MQLPRYTQDLKRVVAEDFDHALPAVLDLPPSGGSHAERVRTFAQNSARLPHPVVIPPDSPEEDAGPAQTREWERYWTLLQAQSWTLSGVLFRLERAQLPYQLRRRLDNIAGDVYWNQDQGFPTPPPFLAMLARYAEETPESGSFMEAVEDWLLRLRAMEEVEPLLDLRDELRVQVLVAAAHRELSPGQAHGGSLALDILAYQALARLDVRRVEAERGLKPRYEQLVRLEIREAKLLCEEHLPRLARPQVKDAVAPRGAQLIEPFLASNPPPGVLLPVEPTRPSAGHGAPAVLESLSGPEPPLPHFADLRSALASEVPGLAEPVLDRMALILHLHVRGFPRQRVLLTGAAGSGKTFLAQACGRVLKGVAESHLISVPDLAETGWRGGNLAEALGEFLSRCGGSTEVFESGILVVEEFDKAAPSGKADGAAYESKRGKQQSLLALLGGEPVLLASGRTRYPDTTCETARILVLCTGAFSDSPWGAVRAPSSGDLVRAGFMREISERITAALFLSFQRPDQLVSVFSARPEIAALTRAYRECGGYELEVTQAALRYVARLVLASPDELGPRSGMALLTQAVQERLIDSLKAQLPAGERIVIAPDDISPPPRHDPPDPRHGDTPGGWVTT